ncbi:MAG: quinone-dependent dihydroorotate dehydrogenase, partial [Proteobacteria bacterium]|nr:quinone-dependent dihydroorotate dehydrogenase [Pseudomonadota bacterium]
MYSLARPLLFTLPPEQAHCLAMQALECRLALKGLSPPPVAQAKTVMGLAFANPLGLAAGFDKNAAHIDAVATLGFGFIEVGGVTPLPQAGNPTPRIFRLPPAEAIINRMGLNNIGAVAVAANLKKRRYQGIVAVN